MAIDTFVTHYMLNMSKVVIGLKCHLANTSRIMCVNVSFYESRVSHLYMQLGLRKVKTNSRHSTSYGVLCEANMSIESCFLNSVLKIRNYQKFLLNI